MAQSFNDFLYSSMEKNPEALLLALDLCLGIQEKYGSLSKKTLIDVRDLVDQYIADTKKVKAVHITSHNDVDVTMFSPLLDKDFTVDAKRGENTTSIVFQKDGLQTKKNLDTDIKKLLRL